MLLEIQYTAQQSVTDAVGSLGRTEDVRFSPSNRRLAVASFIRNRIVVFDIDIASSLGATQIALTGGVELSSPALRLPHGLDFIDDNTLIVTSRGSEGRVDGPTANVALFRLPPGEEIVRTHEVLPIARWPANGTTLLNTPGSVAVTHVEEDVGEVLICNNYGHTVTRHLLDRAADGAMRNSEILLNKYLNGPDGVSLSPDRRWIAVSNHTTHNVLLYENSPALNSDAKPDGILRCIYYPHGLRFSADGRHLFVADAGAPYLHIYAQDPDQWRGVRHPVATVRIMDEAVFQRGRCNPENGGPKGLDIDACSNILVVTSECQPLAFFDVPLLLQHAFAGGSECEKRILSISHELSLMQEIRMMAERAMEANVLRNMETNALRNTMSWRITAPLRRLKSIFRRVKNLVLRSIRR
jgi:DNA-binding beta-propeller fold protein YncE